MEKTSVEKKGKERDTMVPNTANFASCISNFRLRFWFSVSEIQLVETTTTRKNCRFIYSLEAKAFCQHLSLRITEALSCHVLKEKKSIYPLNERCVRKLLLYYSMWKKIMFLQEKHHVIMREPCLKGRTQWTDCRIRLFTSLIMQGFLPKWLL